MSNTYNNDVDKARLSQLQQEVSQSKDRLRDNSSDVARIERVPLNSLTMPQAFRQKTDIEDDELKDIRGVDDSNNAQIQAVQNHDGLTAAKEGKDTHVLKVDLLGEAALETQLRQDISQFIRDYHPADSLTMRLYNEMAFDGRNEVRNDNKILNSDRAFSSELPHDLTPLETVNVLRRQEKASLQTAREDVQVQTLQKSTGLEQQSEKTFQLARDSQAYNNLNQVIASSQRSVHQIQSDAQAEKQITENLGHDVNLTNHISKLLDAHNLDQDKKNAARAWDAAKQSEEQELSDQKKTMSLLHQDEHGAIKPLMQQMGDTRVHEGFDRFQAFMTDAYHYKARQDVELAAMRGDIEDSKAGETVAADDSQAFDVLRQNVRAEGALEGKLASDARQLGKTQRQADAFDVREDEQIQQYAQADLLAAQRALNKEHDQLLTESHDVMSPQQTHHVLAATRAAEGDVKADEDLENSIHVWSTRAKTHALRDDDIGDITNGNQEGAIAALEEDGSTKLAKVADQENNMRAIGRWDVAHATALNRQIDYDNYLTGREHNAQADKDVEQSDVHLKAHETILNTKISNPLTPSQIALARGESERTQQDAQSDKDEEKTINQWMGQAQQAGEHAILGGNTTDGQAQESFIHNEQTNQQALLTQQKGEEQISSELHGKLSAFGHTQEERNGQDALSDMKGAMQAQKVEGDADQQLERTTHSADESMHEKMTLSHVQHSVGLVDGIKHGDQSVQNAESHVKQFGFQAARHEQRDNHEGDYQNGTKEVVARQDDEAADADMTKDVHVQSDIAHNLAMDVRQQTPSLSDVAAREVQTGQEMSEVSHKSHGPALTGNMHADVAILDHALRDVRAHHHNVPYPHEFDAIGHDDDVLNAGQPTNLDALPNYDEAYQDMGHWDDVMSSQIQHGILCFCRGTRIRTLSGERPVEELKIGDKIVTAKGAFKRVKWIGFREMYFPSRVIDRRNHPVCIRKDAIADGVPYTDLYLSAAHALGFEIIVKRFLLGKRRKTVLVRASALVNGTTIEQIYRPYVCYFHVELEDHELLLANGMAAESFLDKGERHLFTNGKTLSLQHMRHPSRRPQRPAAPRVKHKNFLRTIVQDIARRGEQIVCEKRGRFNEGINPIGGGRVSCQKA